MADSTLEFGRQFFFKAATGGIEEGRRDGGGGGGGELPCVSPLCTIVLTSNVCMGVGG